MNTIRLTSLIFMAAVLGLFLGLPPRGAVAASSDWAQTTGGKMRLVALPPEADGSIRALLEVRLDAGWITYWRDPGASGIPPAITLADNGNAVLQQVRFPVPKIIEDKGLRDYGYRNTVSLVLDLKQVTPGLGSRLNASVFIGVCDTICVPFQANLALVLAPGAADPAEVSQMEQAESLLPDGPTHDFRLVTAKADAQGTSVTLALTLPSDSADQPRIILSGPDGLVFGAASDIKQNGTEWSARFALTMPPAANRLTGKDGWLLVQTGARTMETKLVFE
jgi:DsbC/DsbD-like thiol-disulfide interchange protein